MNIRKLKGRMAEEGVSVTKLCKLTGISRGKMYRVFHCGRDLELNEAYAICDALHITDSEEKVCIFLPTCPNNGTSK